MKPTLPRLPLLASCVLATLFSTPLSAHHSPAAYDVDKSSTFTGTITRYSFRNPHVYMSIRVTHEDGSTSDVEIEAGASSVIQPLGFTRDAVKVGDVVTVNGSPSKRRPESQLLGRELYTRDGTYYPLHIQARSLREQTEEKATSIAGTWFAATDDFYGYLSENRNDWSLTPEGQEAMASIDPKATPQKDCIPLASPTLMLYPVAKTITIEPDRVVFDIDWLDAERVVWTDGREHPPASETFLLGHSTGHWEGTTLVIDTTNYQAHPMGLSLYLPGSTQKHLTERLELGANGRQIRYSGRTVDPEYLAEPVTWSGVWAYQPDMQHSNEACDLETAYEFLDD